MLLSEFITINEAAVLESAVNLDMMNDRAKNLKLCEGFVFNYNSDRPKSSTVGLLDLLRRSFHSPNEHNIHCVVQDYGKGKTHFALTIANFFSKAPDSEEVQKITHNVSNALNGKDRAILENLQAYKGRGKHLVICLRGDKSGDLRKHFLDVVIDTLNKNGIVDSIAHQLCQRPLAYLQQLDKSDREKADLYLNQISADTDIEGILDSLRQQNSKVIPLVIKIADEITNGFAPDFTTNVAIEDILANIVQNLCSGSSARFQGILILFDELNAYLDGWLTDRIGAGGSAPQNLTVACRNHTTKITLMSFTQIDPKGKANREGYQAISTRLAPLDATHNAISSLEQVIDNVIVQQENQKWQEFSKKWQDTLRATSNNIYKRAKKYQDGQNLTSTEFHTHLGLGCFPLHPLAAYLLCNFEFTQGRTALEFVKQEVGEFIMNQPAEIDGRLNYLYAETLVDAFAHNFKTSPTKVSILENYNRALETIAATAEPEELKVLKAIFLFTAAGDLLTKPLNEKSEKILSELSGIPEVRLREVITRLCNERQIVHLRADGIYQFWTGESPRELEQLVIAELEEELKRYPQKFRTDTLCVEYCRANIISTIGSEETFPEKFAADNGLIKSDWSFENQIFTIAEFEKFLNKPQEIKKAQDKGYQGIVAYVIDGDVQELNGIWEEVDTLLQKSPLRERLVVAIAKKDFGEAEQNLGRIIQKIRTIEKSEFSRNRTAGYNRLLEDWKTQQRERGGELFRIENLRFHSILSSKISLQERKNLAPHVSILLKELYPFVPSVGIAPQLERKHVTGKQTVLALTKQLFIYKNKIPLANLETKYKTPIDSAFVHSWRLFKKDSKAYTLQEPKDPKIKDAWDKISELFSLQTLEAPELELSNIWQILKEPPYGYHELTFTVLLASWLAFHHDQIKLSGMIAIKKAARDPDPITETKSLEDWAATNILEKIDFLIDKWMIEGKAKLIRHQPIIPLTPLIEQAQLLVQQIGIAKTLTEAFSGFKQLQNLEATQTESTATTLQLSNYKAEGYKKINERLNQLLSICNAELKAESEYTTRSKMLKQSLNLLPPTDEFSEIRAQYESAKVNLELRFKVFSENLADTAILQDIRKLNPTKDQTIHYCEDRIKEIEQLCQKLNNSVPYTEEINKKINGFLEQIAKHNDQLTQIESRLNQIVAAKDLSRLKTDFNKLDFIFKDSKQYSVYQEIQPKIEALEVDLEKLGELESLKQESDTVESCERSLQSLEVQESQVTQRFQPQVDTIRKYLNDQIEIYRKAAYEWIASCEQELNIIKVNQDSEAQGKSASQLMSRVRNEKAKHDAILTKEMGDKLDAITKQCSEIQERDLESQILSRFSKLSQKRRAALYAKLQPFLADTTEDI